MVFRASCVRRRGLPHLHSWLPPGTIVARREVSAQTLDVDRNSFSIRDSQGISDFDGDGQPDFASTDSDGGFDGMTESVYANFDGRIEISDALYLLNHLFAGGPEPPVPYPNDGMDPTQDTLDCRGF